jgi:hypothetical protein
MNFDGHKIGTICHPERSEGSDSLGTEILRGVYTECNECARDDMTSVGRENSLSRPLRPISNPLIHHECLTMSILL